MANKKSSKRESSKRSYPSIMAVADYMHNTVARYCANCGKPMTPSDVNDYGSLCESCYMKEYY